MPETKIEKRKLKWSVDYLSRESDTDLFPETFEIGLIKKNWSNLEEDFSKENLNAWPWSKPRTLLVPKSDFSFRSISQLDPVDSIFLTGLIKKIGTKIERKRLPYSEGRVFSYRFESSVSGTSGLYKSDSGWDDFWNKSLEESKTNDFVLVVDITDWYNQIYHHTIENQLLAAGIEDSTKRVITNLLNTHTDNVSRGIPVGPHATHLLAEIAAHPIDEFIKSIGFHACRYVDDIHIFCNSANDARKALYQLTSFLDTNYKVSLNKAKTKILTALDFQEICNNHINDRPINSIEGDIIRNIKELSKNPYRRIAASKLTPDMLELLKENKIEEILSAYISAPEVDFVRLRWFIRRISQTGQAGGVKYIAENFDSFLPAISEVCRYFHSCAKNYDNDWKEVGKSLLSIIDSDIAKSNSYIRMIIINLFGKIGDMNHVQDIIKRYDQEDRICKREIILTAAELGESTWISSLKGKYDDYDKWHKRAVIYSMRIIPDSERTFWAKNIKHKCTGFELVVRKEIAD